MGTRKPKNFAISTRKDMAACHALGFTYHGGTGTVLVAVDDRGFYHFVRARTSRGVASAAHACRSERDRLAALFPKTAQISRQYTLAELALVSPSWLCDQDGDFVEAGDPAAALAQVWIGGRPE